MSETTASTVCLTGSLQVTADDLQFCEMSASALSVWQCKMACIKALLIGNWVVSSVKAAQGSCK